MDVESDSSLKVLAINILGRFLLNRDNNIRYVALNSLSKVVSEDNAAVQRHRNTIVDCLKDPDISIRQRALDLIYQLVNEQNVVLLTTELLNYLVVAQTDHKVSLSSKIMQIVEKYSPNKKWRVDTVITMLTVAGNITDESVPRTAIIFIAQAEGLQAYATHRLFRALMEDTAQLGLLQVAVWCIGEYGSLLTRDCLAPDADSASYTGVAEQDIINLLDKCSRSHNADTAIKALVVNALMKLTVRFSPSIKQGIVELIAPYRHSMSLELQQRSCEYSVLLGGKWENLRREVLDKMPVLDESTIRRRRANFDENSSGIESPAVSTPSVDLMGGNLMMATTSAGTSSASKSLLDLDDIFGGGAPVSAAPVKTNAPVSATHDLLSDIFSAPPTMSMPAAAPISPMVAMQPTPYGAQPMMPMAPAPHMMPMNTPPPAPAGNLDLLSLGLMNTSISAPASATPMPMIATSPNCNIVAYDKNGFQVLMEASKPNPADPSGTKVLCKFVNMTSFQLEGLVFQVSTFIQLPHFVHHQFLI
jgi:AP-1 complex subunit gamma-1